MDNFLLKEQETNPGLSFRVEKLRGRHLGKEESSKKSFAYSGSLICCHGNLSELEAFFTSRREWKARDVPKKLVGTGPRAPATATETPPDLIQIRG